MRCSNPFMHVVAPWPAVLPLLGSSFLLMVAPMATSSRLHAQSCSTSRISVSGAGLEGDPSVVGADYPGVSADGRYVVFRSQADNLVPDDENQSVDVFVYDRFLGEVELVSVSSDGDQGNHHSGSANPNVITRDGRFVAFTSGASNLTDGDTNNQVDVFVRDRWTSETIRASLGPNGEEAQAYSAWPAISDDGRYVAFHSPERNWGFGKPNIDSVYRRDLHLGAIEMVSRDMNGGPGSSLNDDSYYPSMSSDGRYVAFLSESSNLVPGDTNAMSDVFVRDMLLGQTERVSVDSAGNQGNLDCGSPSISADGRYVAFASGSTNLVPGGTNGWGHVFVHDRQTRQTTLVSRNSAGLQGDGHSYRQAISADGRFVAFESNATNLAPGDTNLLWDVFRHDRQTGETLRASVSTAGVEGNDHSFVPVVGNDGAVAYASWATNLVPSDTNGTSDVFVRDCLPGQGSTYCTTKTNSLGCASAFQALGRASASSGEPFSLRGLFLLNQKPGMLLYSVSGPQAAPFRGGYLCVAPLIRRTPLQSSGGTPLPGAECNGWLSYDFNARIGSGVDPALAAGRQVWAQYFSRDPGFPAPDNVNLTDAATFIIQP